MAEITVNGIRLWYEDRGEGPSVVLIGGTSMPTAAWDLTLRPALIAAGYRVVAFDGRGVGRSDAPPAPYALADLTRDVAGLVQALALAPCHVVGLSLGGFVAEDLLWRPLACGTSRPGRRARWAPNHSGSPHAVQ